MVNCNHLLQTDIMIFNNSYTYRLIIPKAINGMGILLMLCASLTFYSQTEADARAFGNVTEETDGFPGTNVLEVTDNSQVNRIKVQHNVKLS